MTDITNVIAALGLVIATISLVASIRRLNMAAAIAMLEAKIDLLDLVRKQDEYKIRNLERLLKISIKYIGADKSLPPDLRRWAHGEDIQT